MVAPIPDDKVFRRYFCCCIPVRAGVIFLTLLGFLGGAGIAALGIMNIIRQTGNKGSSIIQIVSYGLLAFVSIFGLIGAASRRLTLVKVFLIVLILHLLASIATGIYAIRITFVEGAQYKVDCVSDSVDPAIIQGCDHALVLLKAFVIGVYILGWLLQTWASVIVFQYMRQLQDEEKARSALKASETW
jgi:hypothetical protein